MLEVINISNHILSAITQVVSCTYIATTLSEETINFKLFKNYALLLILGILMILFNLYSYNALKPLLIYISIVISYKYILNLDFKSSISINFMSMILNVFGEAIFGLCILVFKIPNDIVYKYLSNTPLSNFIMFLIIFILLHVMKKYIIKIVKIMTFEKITYAFYFILALAIALMLSKNIGAWKINLDLIINMIILIVFVIVIISFFLEKYKTYKKTEEFNQLYNQVESVKTLLNRYKKYNHENKNQLIVIRENSVGNEKVVNYIDSILEENNGHKDKWINELSYISDIGISGFLSVKINNMLDNNINVILNISPQVKKFNFSEINSKEYKDLCRIIGIYLDNAYEASRETEKKEVTIEILLDNKKLLIIISNSFNMNFDLDKIDKEGYSTKGVNHGVGLSLARDIIKANSKLEQKRRIIKDYFYQYLYINK